MKPTSLSKAPFLIIQNETVEKYKQTRFLISRLHNLLDKHYDSGDKQLKINDALELMIKIHFHQKERADGQPYINHPLEVALIIIEKFNLLKTDIIISALLHDAIEDQRDKIIEVLGQKQEFSDPNPNETAYQLLENEFGKNVKDLISSLTNPDYKKLVSQYRRSGDKTPESELIDRLYREHFMKIFDNDADAFCIKLADFYSNALAIDNLSNISLKLKFRKKYGPVLPILIEKIQNIGTSHPLYLRKEVVIKDLTSTYNKNYKH